MIIDSEQTVVEKVMELFQELVFDRIVASR